MSRFSVVCLDMAGTTILDGGAVMDAFQNAIAGFDLPASRYDAAMTYVRETMGHSKIEVFRHLLGGEADAQRANAAFEARYAAAVTAGKVEPVPGAVELFAACRAAGIRVCLSTGFSPATREAIITALGWEPLTDLRLSAADAGRGRPWPDMALTALMRLGGGSVRELAVAGDTPSDIEAGLRAGAGLVAGVLTGASTRGELQAAAAAASGAGLPGAPLILDSVTGLLPHLGL